MVPTVYTTAYVPTIDSLPACHGAQSSESRNRLDNCRRIGYKKGVLQSSQALYCPGRGQDGVGTVTCKVKGRNPEYGREYYPHRLRGSYQLAQDACPGGVRHGGSASPGIAG